MATESSPSALLFPAFLLGDSPTCQRKIKAEAKKWAKRYADKGQLPEPALLPVPPGTILFGTTSAVRLKRLDNDPEWDKMTSRQGPYQPQWHFYFLPSFWIDISNVLNLNYEDTARFKETFEAFACRYPWGALAVAVKHQIPNTIPMVVRRVAALLSFWDQLDTVRYVNHTCLPVSLAEWIAFEFQGEIATWVDLPTGNPRTDLQTAIDQMRQASEEEIRDRLMRRLHALIDTEPKLKHREWLKTPGLLERELALRATSGREWVDDLTTGNWGCLRGFLICLDRECPDP